MKFQVQVGMDNAAFEEAPGDELARILRELADRLEGTYHFERQVIRLRDVNGNRVGYAEVTEAATP